MSTTWQILTPAIFSLIGVFVGGVISPLLTSRIEKARAKTKLKPSLIRDLYLVFNHRKTSIQLLNQLSYLAKGIDLCHEDLYNPSKKDLREDILRQYNDQREYSKEKTVKFEAHFNLQLEVEAKLLSIAHEVQTHYDLGKHEKILAVVQSLIRSINKEGIVLDWSTLTREEYHKTDLSDLNDKLEQRYFDLDAECEKIIDKVKGILL